MKSWVPYTSRHTNLVENEGPIEGKQQIYSMYTVTREGNGVLSSLTNLNNKKIKCQVDTGAAVSIISKYTWKKVWGKERPEIIPSNIRLRGFTSDQILVTGKINVKSDSNKIYIYVVDANVPNIAGCDMIAQL